MFPVLRLFAYALALSVAVESHAVSSDKKSAAQRGEIALLTRSFSHSSVPRQNFDALWKVWGLPEKPADFDERLRERYGLHEAPYPNDGLPMGLRAMGKARTGVAIDCMLCHGGSLFGTPYVGLPNTSLDLAGLFQDLAAARGLPAMMPYRVSNVRGTTEATATAVFLIAFRDAHLNVSLPVDLGPVPDQMCEDTPAWWLLKKKKTMYHTGQLDARAVRPLMSFMMSPFTSGAVFKKLEPTFADIREFLLTMEPPRYPFPIDAELAARGKTLFEKSCARCHGSHGPEGEYPNKIVSLDVIGTDPTMVRSLTPKIAAHYRKSWFAQERGSDGEVYPILYNEGYQAPPLDGVWATAPYFHNGSVPTLYGVLNPEARPKVFTRSYRTDKEDFDLERVGWKVTEISTAPPSTAADEERRRVYDTTQPGRSNEGHEFGERLNEGERLSVIEYLKTL